METEETDEQLYTRSLADFDQRWADAQAWYDGQSKECPEGLVDMVLTLTADSPKRLVKRMRGDVSSARIVQLLASITLQKLSLRRLREDIENSKGN